MRKNGVLTYLHSDHLGSTVLETNTSGAMTTDETYLAYGKQRDSGKVVTDNRFTGQKEDGSGLMQYGARYYDPQIGLFVSPDTIVPDAGSVFAYNRSMYTVGNPLKYRDPTGHWLESGLDIVSMGYTIKDINENGLNWENGIGLVADVASLAAPGVAGGGTIVRHADDAYAAGKAGANAAWDWGKRMLGYGDDAAQAVNTICSFSEETLVATSEGLKPISELKAGDLVLAYNEATGETGYYPILDVFAHNDPQLVFLTIDGETITTTPEHPFYEAESALWLASGEFRYNWTPAEGLKVGDFVRSADGTLGRVAKVQMVDRQQVMYNLTVAEAHTFFVGEEGWLVHNSCWNLQYWREASAFDGTKVFQRNDLFDPKLVDATGRTNVQRMQEGLAPVGKDGESLALHHITQMSDSSIVELSATMHRENSKLLHINPNTIPSGIDRKQFDRWRSQYWKNRAKDFE